VKGRHKFVILDDKLAEPQMPASDLFHVARRFDRHVLATTRFELDEIGRSTGVSIQSLADWERALEKDFEANVQKTRLVTVKTTAAYHRPLFFRKVTRAEAERDFEKVAGNMALPSPPNQPVPDKYDLVTNLPTRNLQDYLFRRIVALAHEHRLPMQVHTGYQIANNVIENSHPMQLTNLFMEFPQVQFDLFHSSYPYLREATVLAKSFPNVHVDMCWMHIVSPSAARLALREYMDTLPSTRIMGFGGDVNWAEHSYAHAVMARDNVIRVLDRMVAEGDLRERHAIDIGHRVLCGNAEGLFLSQRI
jgi:predicted TIM-barrel fold metal-dependent hydrolase